MKQCILTALIFLSTAVAAVADGQLKLDLATQSSGVVDKETVDPGSYILTIQDLIPGKKYRLEISRTAIDIPVLPSVRPLAEAERDVCDKPLDALSKAFEGVTEERRVPVVVAGLTARAESCSPAQRDRLDAIIKQETTRSSIQTLKRGEQLKVTLERKNGKQTLTWSKIFTTGARGEWRVLYGFNFVPNEDEEYFSLAKDGEMGKFDIFKETDNEELDFAPSVFFQWLPGKRRNKDWNYGPVAGLGFDLDNPIVFAGYGATYNENIMFTLGAVFHQQSRLDGQFSLGRAIGENLDNDKLTETTYDVNFYVGVGFRFGSNPFRGQQNNAQGQQNNAQGQQGGQQGKQGGQQGKQGGQQGQQGQQGQSASQIAIETFSAHCPGGECKFTAGQPVVFLQAFSSKVAPTDYEYDWDGDGKADQKTKTHVQSHVYLKAGTFRPRLTIRKGNQTFTERHPPIVVE